MENFRGIASGELEFAPITILTGANNSGKSTAIYALLVLKNVLSNPNQPLDSFFSLIFMNLGGFKETVHLKDEERRRIKLEVDCKDGAMQSTYALSLGKAQSVIQ